MSYVKVETTGNYATIALAREPVNSLNSKVWEQLKAAFDKLEEDSAIRGVIFTSGVNRPVFSAGNDINELYAPRTSLEKYRHFWVVSNRFLAQVYSSRLVTVSAIKGACPAGGCCLSLCCDYRVMTDFGHIGLNEVALGIPVPLYWARLMGRLIGEGPAHKLCLSATLTSPEQALELGLVDEVVKGEDLTETAKKYVIQSLKFPDSGRVATKLYHRQDFSEQWARFAEEEVDGSWKTLEAEPTVKTLGAVLQRLQSKRSKL